QEPGYGLGRQLGHGFTKGPLYGFCPGITFGLYGALW
ncbi:unnamed protein product, partial [Adineta steineri]